MRILHLLNHTNRLNGHVHAAVDLACAQVKLGHHVAMASGGGDFDALLAANNIETMLLNHERRPAVLLKSLGSLYRLVRKWLKAGVMEEGKLVSAEAGTPQGAVASPLLANIYLHYVFDLWANRWRKRHARGRVIIVRYADDIVIGFEHEDEARRFLADMRQRMESSRCRYIRTKPV